ncbi:hypothetical protein HWD99_04455 [Microbacterium sp. C5A9]|uniref:protease inhibitor I42 family protein n=1 Tax=Microbacterium sp. C5A9 TaxID=2736663 RepID=UPI001F51FC35|nr:protease inhibitor I42 family protein [Microbacterium sp. C5A9]MCI1017870.1 hypothetical protein [Microbacterium sp. C5A9]
MHDVRTATVTVLVATTLGLGLMGCAATVEKRVDYTTSSVSLAPGEALIVEFGEVNASVGEAWVLTREPDPMVLDEGDERNRYLGEEGETGAPSEMTYRFAAIGGGTTVVRFDYQFRGSVPDDPQDRRSAEITVTVK